MRKLYTALLIAFVILLVVLAVCVVHINPRLENYIQLDSVKPLSEVRADIKTGDILVQHGTSLRSAAIRTYLQCPATHVGVLIRMDKKTADGSPMFPDAKSDLYVLDMGGRNIPLLKDIAGPTGRSRRDVRLKPLDKVLKSKKASYVYGIVPADREIDVTPEMIDEYFNCEFNWSPWAFDISYKDSRFKVCSTFAAKIHEDCGLEVTDGHRKTPADYFRDPRIYFVDGGK
jgi:hypothetical protein